MRSALKHCTNFFLTCFIALSSQLCFAQANSSYLQLLEGEASNLTLDNKTKAKPNKSTTVKSSTDTTNDGSVPHGLSFKGFMDNLKVNYIGTYFFAKRLSTTNQNNIYTFYQNNNNPQDIRNLVIKLSKKK